MTLTGAGYNFLPFNVSVDHLRDAEVQYGIGIVSRPSTAASVPIIVRRAPLASSSKRATGLLEAPAG